MIYSQYSTYSTLWFALSSSLTQIETLHWSKLLRWNNTYTRQWIFIFLSRKLYTSSEVQYDTVCIIKAHVSSTRLLHSCLNTHTRARASKVQSAWKVLYKHTYNEKSITSAFQSRQRRWPAGVSLRSNYRPHGADGQRGQLFNSERHGPRNLPSNNETGKVERAEGWRKGWIEERELKIAFSSH